MKVHRCFLVFSFICQSLSVYASDINVDIVLYNKAHSEKDQRDDYPLQVLIAALDITKKQYGDYVIKFSPLLLKRNRALRELQSGEKLNIYSAPSRKEWEETASPIYFPIYKGLLNYRRLLINKDDAVKFKEISDIKQLKQLKAGVGTQWSTTKTLRKHQFNVVTSNSYEGLFGMLRLKRFDYYIRGINEIYYEFEARTSKYPNMVIEETIVLNIPLPVFLFVSPKAPRLHQRVKDGLWMMHKDGSFDQLFNKYNNDAILKTAIFQKKLFRIENDQLKHHKIYEDETLWINLNSHAVN